MKRLTLALLVFQIIGCSNHTSTKESGTNNQPIAAAQIYPEKPLVQYKDNGDDTGDGDFALSIVAITETDDSKEYRALSSWENRNVGLLIEVPKTEGDNGLGQALLLKGIGAESDNFVRFIAEDYKLKFDSSKHFRDNSLSYVNMNTFANTLGSSKNDTAIREYKLFFKRLIGDDYAELYLNINNRDKQIQFKEKDREYRPQLLKFLEK